MNRISTLLIYSLIVSGLYLFYSNYSKTLPFLFNDEFRRVNDSYLAEYYFRGDFDNELWNSTDAIDQPLFSRLVIAVSLYPKYLYERSGILDPTIRSGFDYSKFLISNGFIYSQANNFLHKEYFSNSIKEFRPIESADGGTEAELKERYGDSISKPIGLIKIVRNVNSMFAALTVIILFVLLKTHKGLYFASLFTLLFAINPLFMDMVLIAHSEALFILLMILIIYFIVWDMVNPSTFKLIVISIMIGFIVSTKLNGVIIYPVYVTVLTLKMIAKENRIKVIDYIARIITSLLIVFGTFALTNPLTYLHPIAKILEMYEFRSETASSQQRNNPEVALNTPTERLRASYLNLFTYNLYDKYRYFRSVDDWNYICNVMKNKDISAQDVCPSGGYVLGVFMVIIFAVGFVRELQYVIGRKVLSVVIHVSFIVIFVATLHYFMLNWPRYILPLLPFVIYYEVCGFQFVVNTMRGRLLRYSK